jgi:hypothetical protein
MRAAVKGGGIDVIKRDCYNGIVAGTGCGNGGVD